MQDPSVHPEAALLHAILHRIEGDIENARAWYGSTLEAVGGSQGSDGVGEPNGDRKDDASNVLEAAWPVSSSSSSSALDGPTQHNNDASGDTTTTTPTTSSTAHTRALAFLDAAASIRSKTKCTDEVARLATESLEEIRRVLRWCEEKYGTASVSDATTVWTRMAEEHREMAQGMIVGGEGWREF